MLPVDEVLSGSFAGSFENSRNSEEFPEGLTTLARVIMLTPLRSQDEGVSSLKKWSANTVSHAYVVKDGS